MELPCRSCGSFDIYFSQQDGSRICTNCGLILETNIPSDEAEWYNGVDDDGVEDQGRCGRLSDKYGFSDNMACQITMSKLNKNGEVKTLLKANKNNTQVNRKLVNRITVVQNIKKICNDFAVKQIVVDSCLEIYGEYLQSNSNHILKQKFLIPSIIYTACLMTKTFLTHHEICTYFSITKSELLKTYQQIKETLGLVIPIRTYTDYIDYYGSLLKYDRQERLFSNSVISKVSDKEEIYSRSPSIIAAGALLFSSYLFGKKLTIKDITNVTQTGDGALRHVYKELYKVREDIVMSLKDEYKSFIESKNLDIIKCLDNLQP